MSTVYMYISERCAANSLLAPPQVRGSTQWHDGTVLLFACLFVCLKRWGRRGLIASAFPTALACIYVEYNKSRVAGPFLKMILPNFYRKSAY